MRRIVSVIASDTPAPATEDLQAAFLGIAPRIVLHGEVVFRRVRCPHRKEEYLAEMTALCWRWLVRLARQGKDATQFVSALATFAARQVWSGRRLCGQEKSKDAMSGRAQRRHRFSVSDLPQQSTLNGNPLEEALRDTTQSTPDELAAFRVDFPQWLDRLGERNRSLALDMALGNRTDELAESYQISRGRVSQLRRELHDNWERFHGEAPRYATC
jgi:hypothetical protein